MDDLEEVSPEDSWRHDAEDYAATLRAMADFIDQCPEIVKGKTLGEACADVLAHFDQIEDLEAELEFGDAGDDDLPHCTAPGIPLVGCRAGACIPIAVYIGVRGTLSDQEVRITLLERDRD